MKYPEPLTREQTAWLKSQIDQHRRQVIKAERARTGQPRQRKKTYWEAYCEKHLGFILDREAAARALKDAA